MPYHGDALGASWEALTPSHQGFLLGVITGMGAGSIGVTVALLLMLGGPFAAAMPGHGGPYPPSASRARC